MRYDPKVDPKAAIETRISALAGKAFNTPFISLDETMQKLKRGSSPS